MNKQVWKFELTTGYNTVKMPKDARILSVQNQNGTPCLWALVNPDNPNQERVIEAFGTGHEIYCDMGIDRRYLDTVQFHEGSLVVHYFERLN